MHIACSGDLANGLAGQIFAKEIRHVIDGSNQPSQQKPGIVVTQEKNAEELLV